MLKKMKFLSSLLKSKRIRSSLPSCHQQPRTLSFKALANKNNNDMFKTINSAFDIIDEDLSPELSLFTDQSFECATSFSTSSEDHDPIETLIHELCSDNDDNNNNNRIFFELDETSSIFEASKGPLFKDSVVLSLDSNDPFVDFKKSMEEMVEALGLKEDWEGLEDLLSWYLKVNEKSNHGYIVGAFVDLLVGLEFSNNKNNNNSSSSNSYLSPNILSSPSNNNLSCYSTFQSSSSCSTSTTLYASNQCIEGERECHHNHNSLVISGSSSLLLLEQVKEEIILHEDIIDEASSSSTRSA
ncbi:transcription repressor OFP15-like [Arachis duranensis]|uniref:Transcription repressor n=1 Tax=Arachis duranensis TaxID=130453 RepID=A0A6P5N9K0_ARADU|nr:transcription repressor OFP15-like [Arachis duranensis]